MRLAAETYADRAVPTAPTADRPMGEHVRLHLPSYVSHGGKVVELSPQEILELRARDSDTGNRPGEAVTEER